MDDRCLPTWRTAVWRHVRQPLQQIQPGRFHTPKELRCGTLAHRTTAATAPPRPSLRPAHSPPPPAAGQLARSDCVRCAVSRWAALARSAFTRVAADPSYAVQYGPMSVQQDEIKVFCVFLHCAHQPAVGTMSVAAAPPLPTLPHLPSSRSTQRRGDLT